MIWDGLLGMGIILLICLMVYSKMRKQTLRETIDEIKEQIVENKDKMKLE
tara:strand:+ start:169 stop:318 length:150 start_codon:yes stop_codon:yes gene_type:complete